VAAVLSGRGTSGVPCEVDACGAASSVRDGRSVQHIRSKGQSADLAAELGIAERIAESGAVILRLSIRNSEGVDQSIAAGT